MITPIPQFENYGATEDGKIYSFRSNKFLKPKVTIFGYEQVRLYKGGISKYVSVHKLVALTYLPPPKENETQINHKDEVKTNNHVSNLEWCTCSYNINYGSRNRIVSEKQIINKTKAVGVRVEQYDIKSGETIKVWDSLRSIERELGIAHIEIGRACQKGKHKCGYGWRYASENDSQQSAE